MLQLFIVQPQDSMGFVIATMQGRDLHVAYTMGDSASRSCRNACSPANGVCNTAVYIESSLPRAAQTHLLFLCVSRRTFSTMKGWTLLRVPNVAAFSIRIIALRIAEKL